MPPQPGWPEAVDPSAVVDAVTEELGTPITGVTHSSLSGWKRLGAYRIHASGAHGRSVDLVLKTAVYGAEVTPATLALGVEPGPPEYAVLGLRDGALAPFLPRVLVRSELRSGGGYLYLMEDLAAGHRPMYGVAEFLAAAASLPRLHSAIESHAGQLDPVLLELDHHTLVPRLRAALGRLATDRCTALVPDLLERWSEIESIYAEDGPRARIHGDLNHANVLVPRRRGSMKVLDWEWAMRADPVDDLASMLKLVDERLQRRAILGYASSSGSSETEVRRRYLRARVRRLVLDTAFLGLQDAEVAEPVPWLQRSIVGSARDALRTLRRVEAGVG